MMEARGEIVSASGYDKVVQAEDNSEYERLTPFDGVVDRTVGVDDDSGIAYQKGEMQLRGYKDKWFAVAFLLHVVVLIGLTVTYVPALMDTMDNDDGVDGDRRHLAAGKGRLLPSRRHLAKVTGKAFHVLSHVGKSSRSLQNGMDEYGEPMEISNYSNDESLEEMEGVLVSYDDDDVSKEEAVEALDEIIEEYYEEEGEKETYYGGDIMTGTGSNYGIYGNDQEKSSIDSKSPIDSFGHYGAIFGIALLTGLVVSSLFYYFLMNSPKLAIKTSLFTNIGYFAAIALIGGYVGDTNLVVKGVVFTFVSLMFGLQVWKRVAFSAALLKASTSAVMANAGVFAYGLVTFVASMLYYTLWVICFAATLTGMTASSCGDGEFCDHQSEPSGGGGLLIAVFFLIVCFYWAIYVFAVSRTQEFPWPLLGTDFLLTSFPLSSLL
jgi:hypothetical protein